MNLNQRLKSTFCGLFITLTAASLSSRVIALPANEVGKIAQDITVLIIDGDNHGSGVLIEHKGKTYTILTAGHVVHDTSPSYQVVTPDDKHYSINYQTVRKLPGVDLAVLQFTSDQNYRVAQLGNSDQSTIGSIVHTAGFPAPGRAIQDRLFQFTSGEISGRPAKAQADGYAMIYTNVTRRGMSGGPVLDSEGRLVGIHGRAEADGDTGATKAGLNLGIPINTFQNLSTSVGVSLNSKTVSAPPPRTTPTTQQPLSFDKDIAVPSFQSTPTPTLISSPSVLPSRPKAIRPSGSSQSPVCAGSSC
jgi:serine protease Do